MRNKTSFAKKLQLRVTFSILFLCLLAMVSRAQKSHDHGTDTAWNHSYKNIVRYDLSGAVLFGFDKYVIFGYERVINPHQSISINFGKVALPKIASLSLDSFQLSKNQKTTGYNISIDYRFYLAKENKYLAPHGIYIGPYYSYNHFDRDNRWDYKKDNGQSYVTTNTTLNIHSIGFELGYQFIFWKRFALDLVMIGPGVGIYDLHTKIDNNINEATKEQLQEGLKQLISQKFPGMNYVFSDKSFDANGTMKTTSIGYRYLVHIGFAF